MPTAKTQNGEKSCQLDLVSLVPKGFLGARDISFPFQNCQLHLKLTALLFLSSLTSHNQVAFSRPWEEPWKLA